MTIDASPPVLLEPLEGPPPGSFGATAQAPSIDWSRVSQRLETVGLQLDLSFAPRRFAGGLANINLLIRVNGAWAVLRRPPEGPLPKGAHDMAREHQVLSALSGKLDLAPRSLHFCSDESVAGAPFQILEFRAGRVIRGESLDPLPDGAETAAALSTMMVDVLARIHDVDTSGSGLASLGRPEGFLARNASGWIARAAAAGASDDAACSAVVEWLQAFDVQEAAWPTLLHNDFKLDNIILDSSAIKAHAVVDWDMATRGDPLMDLATLLSYWAEPGDPSAMHTLRQMPTASVGFPAREAIARAYAERSGRSVDQLLFPRVLAIFKLGVVFRQLALHRPDDPRVSDVDTAGLFAFAMDVAREQYF